MSRIDNIKAFAIRKQEEEQRKKVEETIEIGCLIGEIKDLQPRIQELLETATVCLESGIKLINVYDDKKSFVTDGVGHRIGFYMLCTTDKKVYFMGIKGGGCCGNYNFKTNGIENFEEHIESMHRKDPTISNLKKFLNGFEEFEHRFYNYVDEITKE